jgi:hypothetical protein
MTHSKTVQIDSRTNVTYKLDPDPRFRTSEPYRYLPFCVSSVDSFKLSFWKMIFARDPSLCHHVQHNPRPGGGLPHNTVPKYIEDMYHDYCDHLETQDDNTQVRPELCSVVMLNTLLTQWTPCLVNGSTRRVDEYSTKFKSVSDKSVSDTVSYKQGWYSVRYYGKTRMENYLGETKPTACTLDTYRYVDIKNLQYAIEAGITYAQQIATYRCVRRFCNKLIKVLPAALVDYLIIQYIEPLWLSEELLAENTNSPDITKYLSGKAFRGLEGRSRDTVSEFQWLLRVYSRKRGVTIQSATGRAWSVLTDIECNYESGIQTCFYVPVQKNHTDRWGSVVFCLTSDPNVVFFRTPKFKLRSKVKTYGLDKLHELYEREW